MKKRRSPVKETSPKADTRRGAPATVDLDLVRELARIATDLDLSELAVDAAGTIRIARGRTSSVSAAPAPTVPHSGGLSLMPAPEKPAEAGTFVTSPFVGTFYRASSPDAAAFVEVGHSIRKGQVVCIVEAMKLMNEIESEFDGRITEIMVKNGEHVEYGQPLFRVEKG